MKRAFTTAELLLAMTIIGVIAALVMPPIIKDYNMKTYTSAIKNSYSNIMTAVENACVDNNVSELSQTKYIYSGNEQDFLNTYFVGQPQKSFANSYNSQSGATESYTGENTGNITLKNGNSINMYCDGSKCTFTVDTNGKSSPNTGGYDMFQFAVNGDNTIKSEGDCASSAVGKNCINDLMENDWNMRKY